MSNNNVQDRVRFTIQDGIGVIQLNSPRSLNALDWGMQERFEEIINECYCIPSLKLLIITGTGSVFTSGGNVREHFGKCDTEAGKRLNGAMARALRALTYLPIPVIAAINGDCYGGGWEILSACDLRIMASSASINFVHIKVGITTVWGGTPRLVRLIGLSRAMELLLTGRRITSAEAQQIGLIHRVEDGDILAAALSWAKELAELPQNALCAFKTLLYECSEVNLDEGYEAESDYFLQQWVHPNHIEAVNAFVEKRVAQFNLSTSVRLEQMRA